MALSAHRLSQNSVSAGSVSSTALMLFMPRVSPRQIIVSVVVLLLALADILRDALAVGVRTATTGHPPADLLAFE